MGQFDPGRFRERVTILRPERVQNATYGSYDVQFVELATVWAEVQDMLPSRTERMGEGIEIARRPARIRMRYRADVDSSMQLLVRGRNMRIVAGPAEIGHCDVIELVAEELTTEGQEP